MGTRRIRSEVRIRGLRSEVRGQSPLAWLWLGTRMAVVVLVRWRER